MQAQEAEPASLEEIKTTMQAMLFDTDELEVLLRTSQEPQDRRECGRQVVRDMFFDEYESGKLGEVITNISEKKAKTASESLEIVGEASTPATDGLSLDRTGFTTLDGEELAVEVEVNAAPQGTESSLPEGGLEAGAAPQQDPAPSGTAPEATGEATVSDGDGVEAPGGAKLARAAVCADAADADADADDGAAARAKLDVEAVKEWVRRVVWRTARADLLQEAIAGAQGAQARPPAALKGIEEEDEEEAEEEEEEEKEEMPSAAIDAIVSGPVACQPKLPRRAEGAEGPGPLGRQGAIEAARQLSTMSDAFGRMQEENAALREQVQGLIDLVRELKESR
eukprot:NODE_7991_length_1532_cov_3.609964.p1 GENE.NODE_7991_length_1532_cov_3.609964~~NODE_7991_length_1532_cov_3.609964.p1  ORF type:complete len:339 (+),score=94.10 NODE_7991_length_1532_cov_3.609964:208-1224(+)